MTVRRLCCLGIVLAPAAAVASTGEHPPVATIALGLALLLVGAKLGAEVAVRLRQPAVLGELVAGMVLGNVGVAWLRDLAADPYLGLLAELGVIVLLFEVGLESTVAQMMKVGASASLVATLGVAAPMLLGWLVGSWLLPGAHPGVHLFLGATLTATSVGITARVLKDLGKSTTAESRIILGAAVIDDVLGLLILSVVTSLIAAMDRGGSLAYGDVAASVVKAGVFLGGSLTVGVWIAPRIFRAAGLLQAHGALIVTSIAMCLGMAWASAAIGLAPIVGAFAAGLILEDVHFRDFASRGERTLEDLLHPISSLAVPLFFVVMGLRTDIGSFARPGVAALAATLTAVAILGKQVCGLGVLGKGIDRLTVGIGMIPRGEVGLVFANIGTTLTLQGQRVVTPETYSAIVVMVIVTTLVTPPALTWSLGRGRAAPAP